jgi:hypothetical protein
LGELIAEESDASAEQRDLPVNIVATRSRFGKLPRKPAESKKSDSEFSDMQMNGQKIEECVNTK